MVSGQKRIWLALAIGLIGVLGLVAVACGDDGGEEASAVEAAIRDLAAAWNAKDVDGALALVTDNFIATDLDGATREEAPEILAEFIGEEAVTITEISDVEVSGDTASAVVESTEGKLVVRERDSLVRQDDAWLLDSIEDLGAEIPEGTTAVDLALTEYAFNFDEAAITDGNIAFNASNIGGEQHFVFVAKVPEDLDIEQAIRSDEEPEGAEDIGGTDVLEPGDETTLVFADPLGPGRYVMLCFVEAADGEPHALKGMWAEFTIE